MCRLTAFLVFFAVVFSADAKVVLGTPFSDNMVLQRGCEVPVWGTAKSGEMVSVTFAGQERTAVSDESGAWRVTFDAMPASKESRTLRVVGKTGNAEVRNVLVGEVWFASGQSNMEYPIWGPNPRYRDANGLLMTSVTRRPFIRYVKSKRAWSVVPKRDLTVVWREFSPESFAADMKQCLSAVAFYYALELYAALDIPIGIIDSSWGGSNIDAWTPRSGYAKYPALKDVANFPVTERYDSSMNVGPINGARHQPTVLWNGMVAAWAPYAMRGVIWYQGCHNWKEPERYAEKMHALYDGWSKEFENPNMKFYFVQLAPFKVSWFDIQLAQSRFAGEEPNAALVTTCDIGNFWDGHPNGKDVVAKRLSLHALRRDYGFDAIKDNSPTLKNWKVEGGRFVLTFNDANGWYMYNKNRTWKVGGFEVAGSDGKWVPANVCNKVLYGGVLDGKELIVSADGVKTPCALRYLASSPYEGVLYSSDSALPLGPFEIKVKQEDVVKQ